MSEPTTPTVSDRDIRVEPSERPLGTPEEGSYVIERWAAKAHRCEAPSCQHPTRDIAVGEKHYLCVAAPWFPFNPVPGKWTQIRVHEGCGV